MLKPVVSFRQIHGLSLIELMVALVAGLVVSGAAVALIVSIIKSNAATIQSTRLTQELRTTAEVITRDLRRARSITDPIANVGLDPTKLMKDCNAITPAAGVSATCVTFGYDCTYSTAGVLQSGNFVAIGLAGGAIRRVSSSTGAAACPTTTTGTAISSATLAITTFNVTALAAPADGFAVQLEGKFANDSSASPLIRKITQEIRVRSAAVN